MIDEHRAASWKLPNESIDTPAYVCLLRNCQHCIQKFVLKRMPAEKPVTYRLSLPIIKNVVFASSPGQGYLGDGKSDAMGCPQAGTVSQIALKTTVKLSAMEERPHW